MSPCDPAQTSRISRRRAARSMYSCSWGAHHELPFDSHHDLSRGPYPGRRPIEFKPYHSSSKPAAPAPGCGPSALTSARKWKCHLPRTWPVERHESMLKMFEMGQQQNCIQDDNQQEDPYVSGILVPDWSVLCIWLPDSYIYIYRFHEVPSWVLHQSTISRRRTQTIGEWRDIYHGQFGRVLLNTNPHLMVYPGGKSCPRLPYSGFNAKTVTGQTTFLDDNMWCLILRTFRLKES